MSVDKSHNADAAGQRKKESPGGANQRRGKRAAQTRRRLTGVLVNVNIGDVVDLVGLLTRPFYDF
jgi:hypothetical protein